MVLALWEMCPGQPVAEGPGPGVNMRRCLAKEIVIGLLTKDFTLSLRIGLAGSESRRAISRRMLTNPITSKHVFVAKPG
jgi:hypothetical protein